MADINLEYLAAHVMLIEGDITFAFRTTRARARSRGLALRRRSNSGQRALAKTKTTQAIVEITTREGARLRYHTRAVRGSATNPMTRQDVAGKAFGLSRRRWDARNAQRLIDTVWKLRSGEGPARGVRPAAAAITCRENEARKSLDIVLPAGAPSRTGIPRWPSRSRRRPATGPGYIRKSVRIIVPSSPGGGTDILARVLAKKMGRDLGQPFMVETAPARARSSASKRSRARRPTATRC